MAIIFEVVLLIANTLPALSFKEVWEVFLHAADKYKKKYKKIPVLIIDNVNRLPKKQLEQVQDYAKRATDEGTATVVFVSSEGRVPRRMIRKSIMFIVLVMC
jgi:chromosomal replication initiation ATPase DnaA